ncbi:hypothetical protein Tco_1111250 [Tanacetum coccineum]|uniref:Uncharacterized protein n=1 Tax=Tanacetum coccineum TaxID=301880 RepID=A0ABQ5IL57_9ASTR
MRGIREESSKQINNSLSHDDGIEKIIKNKSKGSSKDYSKELELKKILIDKMEANNSINRSDIQRQLYKVLVEAYEADKITGGPKKEGQEWNLLITSCSKMSCKGLPDRSSKTGVKMNKQKNEVQHLPDLNIRVNSFTMKMEILLESTSNKLMVEHAEYDESNTYVLERFNTSAGNPVKKILLKLNLSDHRLCKMVVEVLDSSCHKTP